MILTPLGNRVLIKRDEASTKTPGGILLPDQAKEKPVHGKIVAIGPGKLLDDGTYAAIEVKEGDRVFFGLYSGQEIEIEDIKYLVLDASDLLAVQRK